MDAGQSKASACIAEEFRQLADSFGDEAAIPIFGRDLRFAADAIEERDRLLEASRPVGVSDVERTALYCSLDIMAFDLENGRALGPNSITCIETIKHAARWIESHP